MTQMTPIAIVGRGCVLPGALSPSALWRTVIDKQINIAPPETGRFGLHVSEEKTLSYVSGFVTGFEKVFDPARFSLKDTDLAALDPVCQWPLQAAADAWEDAGRPRAAAARKGVFLANLGYPSLQKSDFASDIWMKRDRGLPKHAFYNSGFPSTLIARYLKARGPVLALDAACASSLYAVALACHKLQSGSIDVALVGAVNAADNIILHRGFAALNALSPTGQSRPFHAQADGLVPSEGAAAIVLKRLSDVDPSDHIHGVIRGIGLSNDGRRKGLLAPDGDGQAEAMDRAWRSSGLCPSGLDLLECHATGTRVGDAVEIQSAARNFAKAGALPIGSLKANMGHLITVAGLASLIKVTSALQEEVLPPMPLNGPANAVLKETQVYPITEAENWTRREHPRRAAVSNFGFGGNNAHLIIEQFEPETRSVQVKTPIAEDDIVICGVGLMANADRGAHKVLRRFMNRPLAKVLPATEIGLDARIARTPPTDLDHAEPHQLATFDVARQALQGIERPEAERIAVFAGMNCAGDATRFLARDRIPALLGLAPTEAVKLRVSVPLVAADVTGAMANITANRLTMAEDIRGAGFSIMAEDASGLAALDVAMEALKRGEIDMALVTAADFASEPLAAAARKALGENTVYGDLASAITLKRRRTAEAEGDPILGTVGHVSWTTRKKTSAKHPRETVYGSAPAANLIFDLASTALLNRMGQRVTEDGAEPNLTGEQMPETLVVPANALSNGGELVFTPAPAQPMPDPMRPHPHLAFAAASGLKSLATALEKNNAGMKGSYRIAILAASEDELADRTANAVASLRKGEAPAGDGIWFGKGQPEGELAFAFTGSAAAYPRMGRNLFAAFPEVAARFADIPEAQDMARDLTRAKLGEFEQLCAVTLLAHAQTYLLRDVLGIKPDALIGLSLGETISLMAFGYWKQPGELVTKISKSGMYDTYIGGKFDAARISWKTDGPANWVNWRISAPLARVKEEIAKKPHAELTIIYSDSDSLIGGPPDECRAVAEALGPGSGAAVHQHLLVHARAMEPYAETWRNLHTRPTYKVPDTRIYTNATNDSYTPTRTRAAEMLTRQACHTIDFPKTVEKAYADGVRSFIEIGPRDTLTQAISATLGRRDHLAVAADRIENSDLSQIAELVARLFAEGRDVNIACLADHLNSMAANAFSTLDRWNMTRPIAYPTPDLPEPAMTAPPLTRRKPSLSQPVNCPLPAAPSLPPPAYPISIRANAPKATPQPASAPSATHKLPPPRTVTCGSILLPARAPIGPNWQRPSIAEASSGKMSDLFGPAFIPQDKYRRQVRLPDNDLLLVDRITGIDAEPLVESAGVIWTETDVSADSWFTSHGYVRPGPLIECGQADLTLIGWMGADMKNKDERVYRLLGCEITFHEGGLPQVNDTLKFQIEVTGHATLAGIRMFFFQSDCRVNDRVAFSVRNGQAGFFTDEELANGKGLNWDAATSPPPTADPTPFKPMRASAKRSFSAADVSAYRKGDAYTCFGKGFEITGAHSQPPCLPDGKLALFDDVTEFDPVGGPWGRGYLKARAHTPKDHWFYNGHFHEDPCMPGTLMAEAAVQAIEFYAAAIGLTVERDGYVFDPVPEKTAKFVCRGQVIPDADHDVTYEVFIDEVIEGETPEIYASVLASSDGRKVFYCPRFGLRLRRNWPAPRVPEKPLLIGPMRESRGDQEALLECANGAPSSAFGDLYAPFDTAGRSPRLPQPPYHTMSRVVEATTRPGERVKGARIVAEYDIPPDAWYFDTNHGVMPFAVLTEIVLQPCGWLASHCGFALDGGSQFRNLDGDGHVYREVWPEDIMIRVDTTLTSFSRAGPMTIVNFELTATIEDGEKLMDLKTAFGFFPSEALARQAGLPKPEQDVAYLNLPPAAVPLGALTEQLATGMLCMLDKVDFFDPHGGCAGLGLIRGQQNVNPRAWYFKAHFYQDPVQPGSLGLDMLVQLLGRAALLKGLDQGLRNPHIETVAADMPVKWSYRGQVTPERERVTTVMEITEIVTRPDRVLVTGRGSLWCDGLRIYQAAPITLALREA